MKTTKTPDHNPTGRTRPKRKMGTVLRAKLSKYRARVSEFEDDAPSSTVVRWLVVLLLLHLLVIGGVYVRSTWFRNTAETVEMAAALPAPPTVRNAPAPAALPQVPQAPAARSPSRSRNRWTLAPTGSRPLRWRNTFRMQPRWQVLRATSCAREIPGNASRVTTRWPSMT
ncbi:hypothetical protein [Akkermansia muciniphila]|uniref:hypothetical protein n=1 Tax=Akkermansia muciniphila TaxID=239935 RepID=UPI00117738BA|nr:hypothetical protein [Akkermansia muciniphila]